MAVKIERKKGKETSASYIKKKSCDISFVQMQPASCKIRYHCYIRHKITNLCMFSYLCLLKINNDKHIMSIRVKENIVEIIHELN
uniref:Uncharacterized protein n=1 Tax=Octopus bimaculoides TaxID=37653 RepID=A0A0L8HJI3_OCTBM